MTESTREIRHDWYQTEVAVVVTVLAKSVKNENLQVHFKDKELIINLRADDGQEHELVYKLSHIIVPEQCSYKITPSKIEIKLKKAEGIRWSKLEGAGEEDLVQAIPQASSNLPKAPSYPTSKGTDWGAIEKEMSKQEASEKPAGEEALNKLFQEIYGKGSDEVKKAMNKSYLESGGTVLSTNWNEISKDKVDVNPPDGMEWKKWDS